MTEFEEFITRATAKAKERQAGRSFDATGTIVPTAEREALLLTLPALTSARTNLQNPATGAFNYLAGFDPIP